MNLTPISFFKNITSSVFFVLGVFLMNTFFVGIFSVSVFSAAAWAQSSNQKTLLIIGDSITEGYGVPQDKAFPALIQKSIDQDKINWTIKAAGSSGSTSASGPERIKWLTKSKPDLVLVLLGSNDGLRGIKTEETEKNLNQTIQWAQKNNFKIMLGQLEAPPNYGKEYTEKFSKIFPKVAKENKIPLAPFILKNVGGRSDLNLPDGIHPNEKGHEVLARDLYKFLKPHLVDK